MQLLSSTCLLFVIILLDKKLLISKNKIIKYNLVYDMFFNIKYLYLYTFLDFLI